MIKSCTFGALPDGRNATLYTIENGNCAVKITNYGATLVSFCIDDTDVLIGYDDVTGYIENDGYFGAVIGRVGNRIKNGRFTLDGTEYRLYCNDGPNHLHGGKEGFDAKIWTPEILGEDAIRFTYFSADMEEGYPGNLWVAVTYTLSADGTLTLDYTAKTDKKTVLNLTNHAYFNIDGNDAGTDILDQVITLHSSYFSEADDKCMVTNRLLPVEGTAFDFRGGSTVRAVGESGYLQSRYALGGVDHNFVIDGENGVFRPFATVESKKSGVKMDVCSDHPGVQLYTGNFINEGRLGKNGVKYRKHSAFCLETQNYPDAPNNPDAPCPVLAPGETYHHVTTYRLYK